VKDSASQFLNGDVIADSFLKINTFAKFKIGLSFYNFDTIYEPVDLVQIDEHKDEVAVETNFKILNHRLDFFGICSNCMAEKVSE